MKSPRQLLYIGVGILLTGIGIVGIVTPVLPTTIFLIGAGWCFARSSPFLEAWLYRNRITGPFLKAYREQGGISLRRGVLTIMVLWVTLAVSAWFVKDKLWLLIMLGTVGVGVSVHLIDLVRRGRKLNAPAEDSAKNEPERRAL